MARSASLQAAWCVAPVSWRKPGRPKAELWSCGPRLARPASLQADLTPRRGRRGDPPLPPTGVF